METKYPHIFSPIKIGNVVFKNRIWAAPAGAHPLQAQEPYPTEPAIAYYREKARGGSAAITISAQRVDKLCPEDGKHNNYSVYPELYHRYWEKLTSAIHYFGAKASLELLAFELHGYNENNELVEYSISGDYDGNGVYMPPIPKAEIERISDDYAEAAEKALACGFDMVLIHGGHGTFISQFISPKLNQRTDEFGGSAENRAKFPIMILDKIRERVGNKLLIEYRISGSELFDEGGFEIADCIDFLKRVQDKIDIAQVSVGTLKLPGGKSAMHPTIFRPPGCNTYVAAAVKADKDIKIPIITLGAYQDPELIEQTLAEGKADIVAMARGTIADAQCVNKAREGKEDEIIPCIKCFHCLHYSRFNHFACSVNPEVGRENDLPFFVRPVKEKKKVIIIGGGPAGMAAAIYSKQRGHDVTLYEKNDRLGGKMIFSEYPDFKYDLRKFMNYQIHMVDKMGVSVKTGVKATPEMIAAEKADVVMTALGADPIMPPIPGITSENVIAAESIYGNLDKLGKNIVVIGAGEVGCESAIYMIQNGKNVSIIEMRSILAPDMMGIARYPVATQLEESADCYLNARCTNISEGTVSFIDENGNKRTISADTVVISAGTSSRDNAAEEFRNTAPAFWNIGDSYVAGSVRTSTRTAYDAAMQI